MKHKGQFLKSRRKGRGLLDRTAESARDKIRLDGVFDSDEQEELVRKTAYIIADAFVEKGKTVHGFFWQRGKRK